MAAFLNGLLYGVAVGAAICLIAWGCIKLVAYIGRKTHQ